MMASSDFTGMRKVTIKDTATGGSGTFVVLTADKIGSDGITIPLETNELTESSFAGDITSPGGTNVGTATLSLLPKSVNDLASIWPSGWDATTESWQPPIGGCILNDVTLAFEKVCDSKGNIILRHAQIALAFELSISRDDSFVAEVNVYPTLSPGSEYGLSGSLATAKIPYQIYNGVYNSTTDVVAFDADNSQIMYGDLIDDEVRRSFPGWSDHDILEFYQIAISVKKTVRPYVLSSDLGHARMIRSLGWTAFKEYLYSLVGTDHLETQDYIALTEAVEYINEIDRISLYSALYGSASEATNKKTVSARKKSHSVLTSRLDRIDVLGEI